MHPEITRLDSVSFIPHFDVSTTEASALRRGAECTTQRYIHRESSSTRVTVEL